MRIIKFLLIIFSLLFFCTLSFASIQNDSLINKINDATDSEKVEIYKELASQNAESNPIKFIEYLKKALIISQNQKDIENEYLFLISIAKKYRELEMFDEVIEYSKKALQFAINEKNSEKLTDLYNELGIAYASMYKYDESLEYFNKYMKIQEDNLNKENMIIGYGNIANLYMIDKDYKTSLEFSFKAVDIEKETNDSVSLAYTLNNIALIYKNMGKNKNAWDYFAQAEEIANITNNENVKIHVNSNISELAYLEKDYNKALNYLEKNRIMAQKSNSVRLLRETYGFFSDLYVILNDYKKAYEYIVLYNQLNDSIENIESIKKINELKIIYDTKSRENENEILKRDIDIQKISNYRQQIVIYFLIFISLLIVLLIIVLFNKFRTNKKYAVLLKEKIYNIEIINTELKDLNTALESKVSERTIELQSEVNDRIKTELALKGALKKAEEANMLKDSFLSNISHEIRTPLNAIIGLSSLMADKFNDDSIQYYIKYTDGIQQSSKRLLHLLNNIIDFSMLKSNTYNLETKICPVDIVINNAAQLHIFKANEKGLKFSVQIPEDVPEIYVDRENLIKVLSDVIDNAVKYTEKGEIRISVEKNVRQKEIVISIKDTGIGIEHSFLPHIFDSFSQENDSYSKIYQGVGIGLPLAKKMIELMNGRLEISSMKNKGTTVKMFIPEANYEVISNENIPVDDLYISNEILKESGIEVLIVEDDEFNALVLGEILTKISNPVVAKDGFEALQIVDEYYNSGKKFNIMLIDINLPGNIDGIELMTRIRKKYEEYKDIPFIAQTAYAMSKDREKLLSSGFDDYLAKPIDNDELLVIIKSKLV
ncbi:MAG: ATP-binding protein [Bacteroidota bacterium]